MQLSSSWVGSRQHLSASCGKFWTLHIGKEDKHKIISWDGTCENGSYSELQPAPPPHTIVVTALEQGLTCLHFNFKQIYQWINIFAFSPPFWRLLWLCRSLKFEEIHFKQILAIFDKSKPSRIFLWKWKTKMSLDPNFDVLWGGGPTPFCTSMTVETSL